MTRRRKTCECCGARLSATEDYWCAPCHGRIRVHYDTARAQLEGLAAAGMSPKDAVRAMIDGLARTSNDKPYDA